MQIYESLAMAAVALICMLNDSRSAAAAAAAVVVTWIRSNAVGVDVHAEWNYPYIHRRCLGPYFYAESDET